MWILLQGTRMIISKQASFWESEDSNVRASELNQKGKMTTRITRKYTLFGANKPEKEVPTTDSGTDTKPLEQVQYDVEYNVFANERQYSEQPESISNTCVVEKIPYDTSDPANRFVPDREETLTLKKESRSKLNKDLVKPYDYTKQNKLVDQAWEKHSHDHFRAPTAHDMEILIKTCLMPLALKTQNDSFKFVHELKQEMHVDLKYVESLEKGIDELGSDKAEFSNMYDILLQEYVSNDVMCSYFHSLSDLDGHTELQCLYLHKVKECECLAQKLLKQTEIVRVIHKTNVNRPHLRSTQMKDKVMPNNSQVKFKKNEVEDHQRISSISNKTKSVTACNDSLKSRTSNVNAVCPTCGKCVFNSNHDACVYKFLNDVNARTKKPNVEPISTRKPKIVQLILFIVDSGCTKHMTGNLKLLCNFVEKYLGTVHFGNGQFAPILGYEDLVQGNITIKRVYYVKGLNHNLFSVGQFCDTDLEVAFRKSTCFVRDLQGNYLLTSNRGSDLYTISLQETTSSTCFQRRMSGTEFLNKTLHAFFKEEGIEHQTSTARTPEQNDIFKRQNRTLIEAARTMFSASKLPLLFWSEAIATTCYTQNRSIIIPTHEKTEYHIINDRKLSIRHLHIFGCTCYLTRDGENLDKMKEKGDPCILVGYSTQFKGYNVYNKRT
ncbi:retrovirus-related pol polyprotein from transposon TNT 1-94 [Tanacetum coccineum]